MRWGAGPVVARRTRSAEIESAWVVRMETRIVNTISGTGAIERSVLVDASPWRIELVKDGVLERKHWFKILTQGVLKETSVNELLNSS